MTEPLTERIALKNVSPIQIWYRQKGQNTENLKSPPHQWWTVEDWLTRLQKMTFSSELLNSVTIHPKPQL